MGPHQSEDERAGTSFLKELIALFDGKTPFGPKILTLLPPDLVEIVLDAATNFAFGGNGEDKENGKKTYAWLGRDAGIVIEFGKDAFFYRKAGKTKGNIIYVYPNNEYTLAEQNEIRKREIPLLEVANSVIKSQHLRNTISQITYGDLASFVKEFDPKKRTEKVERLRIYLEDLFQKTQPEIKKNKNEG